MPYTFDEFPDNQQLRTIESLSFISLFICLSNVMSFSVQRLKHNYTYVLTCLYFVKYKRAKYKLDGSKRRYPQYALPSIKNANFVTMT